MVHRKESTDPSDEIDVARWRRRLLQNNGSGLERDENAKLRQYLEELKSHPPLPLEAAGCEKSAEPIQFPGPPTADAPLGQLGEYDVLEELGRGTFGTVYKALDRRLERAIAIKVLNPEYATVPSEYARFEQEARAVSKLEHDHIVRIYDVRTASDFPLPYLVMEWIDGQSLAEQLARRLADDEGPFLPEECASIVRQVAMALVAAHECHLVHRDIKSSNILLERGSGRAKVTDFGLARQVVAASEWSARSGRIIGTLPYMSPEQVLHPDRVGPQSDLYSLGVVLYELLTGERPFRGTSPALLLQVAHDEPLSPRRLNPGVPRDLETICLKCLEKEPARRYASGAALADELQRFLAGEPILARPVPIWERAAKWAKRQRAVATLLAAVVLVTTLGFGGVFWQWRRAEAGRQVAQEAQEGTALARDAERALRQRLEKNLYFQRIALAHHEWLSNRQARADQLLDECAEDQRGWEWRCLQRMFHPEIRTLRGHALQVRRVAFSPDGKRIASVAARWNQRSPGSVIVWDAHSGEKLQTFVAGTGGFYGVAFSPDGKRLAAANSAEGVAIWDLTTGRKKFVAAGRHYDLVFNPSGELLAGAGADRKVRAWDVESGKLKHELAGHESTVLSVTFSPDGAWLASTENRGTVRIWDALTGETLQFLEKAGNRCVAFTPDGRFLASCGYEGPDTGLVKVWEVDSQWKAVVNQRVETGPVRWLCVSPDGQFLALSDARHGSVRIWETVTGRERRVLPAPLTEGVAFSPDGRTLASGGSDRTVKLWDMTQQEPVVTRADIAYASSFAFRPDSQQLAVVGGYNSASGRGTKTVQVWDVRNTVDCRLERILAGHQDWLTSVAYRADGRRLASADRSGAIKIWDSSSGRNLRTMDGGEYVASVLFSPDGQRLATAGKQTVIRVWDPATGELIQTLVGHQGSVHQLAFSPDGKWMASASEDRTVKLWDTMTGLALHTLGGHEEAVHGVAFDSRGKMLATAGRDGLINLWSVPVADDPEDVAQRKSAPSLLRTMRGHTGLVIAVSFSGDDTRLASSSADRTVKLWDVATGQEAITLNPIGTNPPSGVLFSPDGNVLAAGRRNHVTLWDAGDRTQRDGPLGTPAFRQRAIAWHETVASACEKSENWFAANFHLTQLTTLQPKEPMYYYRRGNVYANWADSDQGAADLRERALADFEQALELSGGLLFTGRGDHLTAPHVPFDQYEGFTIEGWVYGDFRGTIVSQGKSGDPENSIWLAPSDDTGDMVQDSYGWESGTGKDHYQDSVRQRLPLGWNHVALVHDGNQQRFYLNGKLWQEQPAAKPGPLNRERMLIIGGYQSRRLGLRFSSGLLRSIRISRAPLYDSEFTPSEVLESDGDTVLLFELGNHVDRMTNSTVSDLSGNGNDGTRHDLW